MDMNKTNPRKTLDAKTASLLREAELAASSIRQKRKRGNDGLIARYLRAGEALHQIRQCYKSDREYGNFLRENSPGVLQLDASTRSNSLWLYRAMNGLIDDRAYRFTRRIVKGVSTCTHPTAIRRQYRTFLKGDDNR